MGFHNGTRGGTGADEYDRERRAAFERMRRELIARLEVLAGERAWVFVGGSGPIPATVIDALPARLRARARRISGVDGRMGRAALRAAVERTVAEASREQDEARVRELLEGRDAGRRGVTGAMAALGALQVHAVDSLLLTGDFIDREPERAESLVRQALAQGAEVEQVSGPAAERLDATGGVAAHLRFATASGGMALAAANG
jgi:stalled ribosome rescue protein Dom34